MLAIGTILYLLAAAGVLAMGAKYLRATPPLDYHARMTEAESLGPETLRVIGTLYKVLGGALLGLGAVILLVTLFGVWNDLLWAKLAVLAGALITGIVSARSARDVERATGVETPWRIAAGLTAVSVAAFVLSVL